MALRRTGFTLFQLLLVLVILALLFALLLPAVLSVRSAAARTQSSNNLKQIALACHNYESANRKFPPGVDDNHFATAAYLLPYIEQDNLFRQLDMKKPCDDKANEAVRKAVVKTFLNPADPQMAVVADAGATNYLYCAGAKHALADNDGLFYLNSQTRFADVSDGLSNTLLAGETLKGNGKTDMTDPRRQHVLLGKDALKNLKDDSAAADWKNGKNIAADRCEAWIDGRFLKGTFTGTRKVNDDRPDVTCAGEGGLSGLRAIENGVNVALADGSVRFLKATISLETLSRLSSRNDGQILGNDF